MMAVFRRPLGPMRGSVTFDNVTASARHAMLRGILSAKPDAAGQAHRDILGELGKQVDIRFDGRVALHA